MTTSKKIWFFVVQLITSFLVLSMITYFPPRNFWMDVLVGVFSFLFLNSILMVVFNFYSLEQGNGYSKLKNKMISKNYFWIAVLFFLSGLGSLLSQKPINDIVLLGVPFLVVWGILMFFWYPPRTLD